MLLKVIFAEVLPSLACFEPMALMMLLKIFSDF
jgi:hypothetical protein